jgi:MSHA pilin protein MshD
MIPFTNKTKKARGFSLIELVITIVIISIALTALSSSLFSAVGRNADPMWQAKATHLAQAYLDEIIAMRYAETSPLGGGSIGSCAVDGAEVGESSRSLFDDVDDYDGLTETAGFLDTSASSNYSGYTIVINVECVGPTNVVSTNSKLIVITITVPSMQSLVFSAFRADL